jgi:hypothetical protein
MLQQETHTAVQQAQAIATLEDAQVAIYEAYNQQLADEYNEIHSKCYRTFRKTAEKSSFDSLDLVEDFRMESTQTNNVSVEQKAKAVRKLRTAQAEIGEVFGDEYLLDKSWVYRKMRKEIREQVGEQQTEELIHSK